jgi:hypothetical protein
MKQVYLKRSILTDTKKVAKATYCHFIDVISIAAKVTLVDAQSTLN